MNERDEKILKHVGRYGLSIRAVIERLFFDGATCDHVVNRLIKEQRLASEGGLPGGLFYYRLTLSEARRRAVPEHRARPKRGAALREALQVLWFCCMSEKARNRVERKQVADNFGNAKGSGKPHCAESHGESSVVYRLYAPGPNSRDEYLLSTLRIDFEVAGKQEELSEWISDQAFGFAVLVETPERAEKIRRMVKKHGPQGVLIHVEVTPGPSTLAVALRERQEKNVQQ